MTQTAPTRRGLHSLIVPLLAAGLFVPLFIFRGTGPLDFWASMALNIVFLFVLALGLDRSYLDFLREDARAKTLQKIGRGVASALVLYAVFFVGNRLSRELFDFAGPGISRVYGFKAGASTLRIVLLIALVIGPGEELFWRGYVQRTWQERFGPTAGWLAAAAFYAAVHIGSGNPMLILAAAICGLFWGYLFLRYRSPLLLCVSHTLWDLLVFIVLPFS